MDALDFAILRRLSPDGEARFWGTRRLIDPRVSAREVGDAVGISETGARARLRSLAERGYLRGLQVWPNPSLFGASLASVEIPVTDTRQVAKLFAELSLVEGVTFARDLLDETDRKVRVFFVSDNPTAAARRVGLLRRLSPSGSIRGPDPYWIPPCTKELTGLDAPVAGVLVQNIFYVNQIMKFGKFLAVFQNHPTDSDKTVVTAYMVLAVDAGVLDKKKEYEKVPVLRNLVPAQVLMGESSFNSGDSISAGLPKYARNEIATIAGLLARAQ